MKTNTDRKIMKGEETNFNTLCRAVKSGDIALAVCTRKTDMAEKLVLCAVNRGGGGDLSLVPIAELIDGNGYELYEPPAA
ncbi:MAG TPA: hypothetical protein DET40_04995 [Lentisphaeria bacterium]|nr:hypothetical protein [Lentisphaeria bacterium]